MGVDYAPHYADIYMAKFEKDALEKCPLKPHTYLRFLDDVFIIWTHGRKSFDTFLGILNNHEPPIKFKSMINENYVDYLDTTIFKILCDQKNPPQIIFDTNVTFLGIIFGCSLMRPSTTPG